MKIKGVRVIIALIAAAILLWAALNYIPLSSKIDMVMQGNAVTADGTVLDEGQIVIRGWRLNYLFQADRFIPTELNILDIQFTTTGENALIFMEAPELQNERITGLIYEASVNSFSPIHIAFGLEQDWCFVRISHTGEYDHRYFTGSTEERWDPAAILELCANLLD